MTMRNARTWVVLTLWLTLNAARPLLVLAQGDARFSGTVLDQTGAIVPGATVTAKNERTGEERMSTANADGRYVIANLKPSRYTLRARFGQFSPLDPYGPI